MDMLNNREEVHVIKWRKHMSINGPIQEDMVTEHGSKMSPRNASTPSLRRGIFYSSTSSSRHRLVCAAINIDMLNISSLTTYG